MKNLKNIVHKQMFEMLTTEFKANDIMMKFETNLVKNIVVIIVVNFCPHTENSLQIFTIPYLSE